MNAFLRTCFAVTCIGGALALQMTTLTQLHWADYEFITSGTRSDALINAGWSGPAFAMGVVRYKDGKVTERWALEQKDGVSIGRLSPEGWCEWSDDDGAHWLHFSMTNPLCRSMDISMRVARFEADYCAARCR